MNGPCLPLRRRRRAIRRQNSKETTIKILLLDIEISPNIATVWGLFNQNIGLHALTGNSEVLCWAAKWHGDDTVWFSSINMTTKRKMLKEIYTMIEEADAIVTYNGDGFDLKILNKEFALQDWAPPAPYKSIDLLKTIRRQFRFTSNKLNHVCERFELGQKTEHRGHQLWLDVMDGDQDAWEEMETYNIQDVWLLEALYDKILPWIVNHPSHAVYDEEAECKQCGSKHVQWRGWHRTKTRKYRRFQCQDCGTWDHSQKSTPLKEPLL